MIQRQLFQWCSEICYNITLSQLGGQHDTEALASPFELLSVLNGGSNSPWKLAKSCQNLFLYFYSGEEYHFEKLTILEKTVSDNVALRDIDGRMISPVKIIYLQFLIFRKMFIGGLSWQTTPGTILARYTSPSAFLQTKSDEFIFLIRTQLSPSLLLLGLFWLENDRSMFGLATTGLSAGVTIPGMRNGKQHFSDTDLR